MICDVNVYIDEVSLCEVNDKAGLLRFISDFLVFSSKFKSKISGVNVFFHLWRNDNLESSNLCVDGNSMTFLQAINSQLSTEDKRRFKTALYGKSSKSWCNERVHSEDIIYKLNNDDWITGDTLAECAELTLLNKKKIIAFVALREDEDTSISVIKESDSGHQDTIQVNLADINVDVNSWIDAQYNVSDFFYDPESINPPTDKQSYLKDSSRFNKTSYKNQGRTVYCCNLTRKLHAIDNLHYGLSAHAEVWDRFGNHLGEANLDGHPVGNADPSKNYPAWLN
ncbi:hypothetical protein [Photobacterium phosphoreum]|uniref:hypothetical protein n=1 Tax=Photobacterium phosphoreum TaxID=659 RepID=UPI0039AFFB8A